ncbi:heavy metal-binding domain-containing protein [Rubellicoccus peritrichatus]|uniref:UPF0145 protein RZN69_02455 n=1 Tax=Rubellicoccus peritrichatus TaxID=3080537 RepID=A0AAQ3LCG2_9BACT|nr:heavy metal-binding domain-containing protein [Puniceicoccus sp. CR14]WOO41934.1 heavy metal-binding domain-containing protein [Puniceicoccus sp. CR14]
MIISTTSEIPGYEIAQVIDVVVGNTVHSKHMGRDFMAGLKGMVGGEIKGYTEMMSEAREEAQTRMLAKAKKVGADAIVSVRFASSSVGSEMSEILAYGTAVKLK